MMIAPESRDVLYRTAVYCGAIVLSLGLVLMGFALFLTSPHAYAFQIPRQIMPLHAWGTLLVAAGVGLPSIFARYWRIGLVSSVLASCVTVLFAYASIAEAVVARQGGDLLAASLCVPAALCMVAMIFTVRGHRVTLHARR